MFINDTKKKSVWNKNPVFCSPLHSSHPLCFLFFSPPSLSHSQCNRHENELLICFPKEFLMPRRPDSRNTMVVVWSTNNFPGLHCLSKALFHRALIMWKMSLSKVSLLFFSHKDVRWRELEFPNMLIRVSVNSAPSSTALESSFSMLENFLCLSNTSVPLSSDAICPQTEKNTGLWSYATQSEQFVHAPFQ